MDLLTEGSSGSRVILARHISVGKSLPESNNEINSTLLCHTYSNYPDFATYYAALNPYVWVLWSCGLAILITICILYCITMRSAMKHWWEFIGHVAVILSVYPVVAAMAFMSLVVPRFRIPGEAIAQQIVTIALYQFFRLIIAECGGVDQLIRSASDLSLETRVPPCCCWPCCILPRPKIQKQTLTWLNYLVLQMPLIQALIYTIILAFWAEDFNLYNRNFLYFQPFVAASILSAMWGVIMCVRTVSSIGHNPKPRFIAIQLVLIIVKLQVGLTKSLAEVINVPCLVKLHPIVFASMIQNSIMMVEMLVISICAWRLYRTPPGKILNNPQKKKSVSTRDENMRSVEVKAIGEGNDNKSFNNIKNIDE